MHIYTMIYIWSYTWPDLHTRLVTYDRLHILTLVVSFCHKISYISFIILFLILSILLSFVSVYYVVIIHEHSSLHTLIRSLLMILDSHIQGIGHFYIVQVIVWLYASRGAGLSLLILVILAFLYSCYYSLISVYHT